MKTVKVIAVATLIAFAAGPLLAAPAVKGLLIYSEPPSTYVESCEFSSMNVGPRYTTVSRSDGQTLNFESVKMTVVDYPTQDPKLDTQETANSNLQKIQALIRQYPQFKAQLQKAQTKWQTALASASLPAVVLPKAETQTATAAQTTADAGTNGDTITTTDGTKYQNVTITKVEPDGIQIMTDSGIVKIPFTALPKDIQTKYGYDPQKAAAYAAQDAAAQHQMFEQNQQALNQQIKAKNASIIKEQQADEEDQRHKALIAKARKLHIEIVQVVAGGVLADPMELEDDSSVVADSLASVGGGGRVSASGGMSYSLSGKSIFIQGVEAVAEGTQMDITAYEDGTYSLVDTHGAKRTVEKWVMVK